VDVSVNHCYYSFAYCAAELTNIFLAGRQRMVFIYDGFKSFNPSAIIRARSPDDICEAVASAGRSGRKVRPMGLGYSWSEHCFTSGISVRTDGMRSLCRVDSVAKTITVDAGVRMGDVTRALGRHGLSLPSLAFLPEMTAGGAVATATHGTNHTSGTMSDFVKSLDIVLASGETKTFSNELVSEAQMRAARVSVGMLGVITRIVFQAIKMPWVRYERLELDLHEFMQTRNLILAKYQHVWVHWSLGTNRVKVDCLEEMPGPDAGFNPYVSHRNAVWEPTKPSLVKTMVRPAWRLVQDLVRPKFAITKAKSKSDVRISMQYAVGTSDWQAVVDIIKGSEFARSNAGQVMEMKFVKGNNLSYLGPNSGQDAVCFNVYWIVPRSAQDTVLHSFEEMMRSFRARPHWGKDHVRPDVAYMKQAYPGWDEFDAVRRSLDKDDIFLTIS
jgi:L-gulono-1,4-lactone dehydrogenase